VLLLSAATLAAPGIVQAQPRPWPSQPVRIVVPFGAGSGTDVTIRLLIPKMQEVLGQPLVVENRPGGGSTVGADHVAKSAPDGSVFLHAALSTVGVAQVLYRRLPYDPLRDLAPVAATVFVPLVLAVTARGWDVRTAQQLMDTLRAAPDRYQYGSNGTGATGHIASANFVTRIGAKAVHVPYRSGAETITALVAGQVNFMHDITGLLLPHHQAGTVRCLFVTSDERSPVMPDVPTMREAGVPQYPAYSWFGLFAPTGTPRAIQDRMAEAVQVALKDQALARRLDELGTPGMPDYGPDRFTTYVREEAALWGPLVRASGATAD
jgi:tripartite-type tricarboxylate transporter receptor subunit TctC